MKYRELWGWRCFLCTHITLEYRNRRPAKCANPKCDSVAFDHHMPVYEGHEPKKKR